MLWTSSWENMGYQAVIGYMYSIAEEALIRGFSGRQLATSGWYTALSVIHISVSEPTHVNNLSHASNLIVFYSLLPHEHTFL